MIRLSLLLLLLAALPALAEPAPQSLPATVAIITPDTRITGDALLAEMTLGGTVPAPADPAEFRAAARLALTAMINRLLLVELAAEAGLVPDPTAARQAFETWRQSLGQEPGKSPFTKAQEDRLMRHFTDKEMIDRYIATKITPDIAVTNADIDFFYATQPEPRPTLTAELREQLREHLRQRQTGAAITARLTALQRLRQVIIMLPDDDAPTPAPPAH